MSVYEIFIDHKPRKIELTRTGENSFTVKTDDKTLNVEFPTDKFELEKRFSIKIDRKAYKVELPKTQEKSFSIRVEEVMFKAEVKIPTERPVFPILEPAHVMPMKKVMHKQVVEGAVTAPMTGKILSVMVKKKDQVKAGQVLCILEAMKMENEIASPEAGTIREVYVSEGSSVREGEVLFTVG